MKTRFTSHALDLVLIATTISAIVAISLRLSDIYRNRRSAPQERALGSWHWLVAGDERVGPQSAPVQIIEFADFQCPFCAKAEPELDELLRDFPTEVALTFRNFPIQGHAFAMPAARAGECAARLGRFAQFKALSYESQDLLGKSNWDDLARAAGILDVPHFKVCLADPEISRSIAADIADGVKLGVDATPTFVINGTEIVGYSGPPELTTAVRKALDQIGVH